MWLWQPDIHEYQYIVQFTLSAVFCFRIFVEYNKKCVSYIVSVSEKGDWQWLDAESDIAYVVSSQSRISSFMLWLNLTSKINPNQSRWYWVHKDSVSEQDYRRLCRIIRRQQSDSRAQW